MTNGAEQRNSARSSMRRRTTNRSIATRQCHHCSTPGPPRRTMIGRLGSASPNRPTLLHGRHLAQARPLMRPRQNRRRTDQSGTDIARCLTRPLQAECSARPGAYHLSTALTSGPRGCRSSNEPATERGGIDRRLALAGWQVPWVTTAAARHLGRRRLLPSAVMPEGGCDGT